MYTEIFYHNDCVHEVLDNSNVWGKLKNYLHNTIPVVSRRDPEEGEERHAKVVKGSVATKTLAWVIVRTLWKRLKKKQSPS